VASTFKGAIETAKQQVDRQKKTTTCQTQTCRRTRRQLMSNS